MRASSSLRNSASLCTSARDLFDFAQPRRLPNTSAVQLTVTQLTDRLIESYAQAGGINHLDGKNLPSKTAITTITCNLLRLVFPGFFDDKPIHSSEIKVETASLMD